MLSDYETGIAAAARKDIPKGTGITAENVSELFELREVNQSMLPGQTVTDLSQMEGKVLSGDLQENEIVTKKDMNDLAGMEASMTEPTELTFTATSIGNSVGGRIRSGDVINVGITFQTDTGESRYRLAGEHIYVLEAMDDTGRPVPPEDTETACIMFRCLWNARTGNVCWKRSETEMRLSLTCRNRKRGGFLKKKSRLDRGGGDPDSRDLRPGDKRRSG